MIVPFPHAGGYVRTLLEVDTLPRAYLAVDILETQRVECRLGHRLATDVRAVDAAYADAAGIVTMGGGGGDGGGGGGGDGDGAVSGDHQALVVGSIGRSIGGTIDPVLLLLIMIVIIVAIGGGGRSGDYENFKEILANILMELVDFLGVVLRSETVGVDERVDDVRGAGHGVVIFLRQIPTMLLLLHGMVVLLIGEHFNSHVDNFRRVFRRAVRGAALLEMTENSRSFHHVIGVGFLGGRFLGTFLVCIIARRAGRCSRGG
mmetsp:Transcript_3510/g.6411  ORF Transcript_3510/g.6411 Transcript_3510/m.6411 type:complete len:261 (-) Transcript_3510:390-1172(-)